MPVVGPDMLKGCTALVTGGTRGIGRAIAEELAMAGARIVVTGRAAAAHAAAATLPGDAIGMVCDVSDEAAVDELFGWVAEDLGHVDILVNNAGVNADAATHKMSAADFRRVIDVNLVGSWLCSRAAIRSLRDRGLPGSIINVSSVAAIAGNAGQANYAASKAGIEALTKSLARENASRNIRVNAIRPGLIRTDMTEGLDDDAWDALLRTVPLGRSGEPHEVAAAALFLASSMSSYLTGTVIDVSGGRGMPVHAG